MTAVLSKVISTGNRASLLAAMAGLFVVAQLIVAVHLDGIPDHNFGHSPSTCAVCVATPASGDPALLTFEFAPPAEMLFKIERTRAIHGIVAVFITDARPRAPPLA